MIKWSKHAHVRQLYPSFNEKKFHTLQFFQESASFLRELGNESYIVS